MRLFRLTIVGVVLFNFLLPTNALAQGEVRGAHKLYGYKNENGELILPYKYKQIDVVSDGTDKCLLVREKKRWGIFDMNGNPLLPIQYKRPWMVRSLIGPYIVLRDKRQFGVYDVRGNTILPFEYSYIRDSSEGVWAVRNKKGLWGYVDSQNNTVIDFLYKDANSFSEGLAAVKQRRKYGYIDINNNLVIPYQFDEALAFNNGIARVGEVHREALWWTLATIFGGPYGWMIWGWAMPETEFQYIDKQGSFITKYWYKYAESSFGDDGVAEVSSYRNGKYSSYIDAKGNLYRNKNREEASLLANGGKKVDSKLSQWLASLEQENNTTLDSHPKQSLLGYSQNNNTASSPQQSYNSSNYSSLRDDTSRTYASDVDVNIPMITQNNEDTFAVIIANEEYRRESAVEYAIADGEIFKQYCNKALGIPESNIHFVMNATLNDIRAEVNWVTKVAKAYNGDAKIIFYYAGHGIPDESTRSAYMLPVDGFGSEVSTGYKLSELYSRLSSCPSRSTIVLLDACFSGAERSGKMLASSRGIALKTNIEVPNGNMIVFSAATGDETAYPYRIKGHGMFTYFLLKKLQETQGHATLGELSDYVIMNVSRRSIVDNSKSQTPTIIPSQNMHNSWRSITLK